MMTTVEQAARRPRLTLWAVLLGVTVGCWTWIVVMARDMYGSMQGASAWMMTPVWDATHLVLLWAMWAVMMAAMMLPSAAPIVLLYSGAARRRGDPDAGAQVYLLAAGYVLVWALFSVAATVVQRVLAGLFLLNPMMEPSTPAVGGALLLLAGLYQLTPLKRACLASCRSPLAFVLQRWRTGRSGAFAMGLDHGTYCLGCCWALMLLLFAGGVMNLTVIAVLTVWVLAEKLAPYGEQVAGFGGVLLLAIGAWLLLR